LTTFHSCGRGPQQQKLKPFKSAKNLKKPRGPPLSKTVI